MHRESLYSDSRLNSRPFVNGLAGLRKLRPCSWGLVAAILEVGIVQAWPSGILAFTSSKTA